MIKHVLFLIFAALPLAACDQIAGKLGLESPALKEGRTDGEGKAVGSACRHSGRAIEDCYSIYSWLPKASVYAGWREMDEYMRENKLETIAPQLPPPEPPRSARAKARAAEQAASQAAGQAAVEATPLQATPPPAAPNDTTPKSDSSKH
ncbi:hypothetical protein [Azonexus sp.]|uniref:hypothetical protein n=1 Tax=Azonexus sp. TaxID=1872668 RepID=UPI0027BAA696|nr:hypothetical protein [Azonexus sp.]